MSISKAKQARIQQLQTRWTEARAQLSLEEEEVNRILDQLEKRLNTRIEALNAVVSDVNGLRDEIMSQAQATYDKRSYAWKDSEKGMFYEAWIGAWSCEIESIDPVYFEAVDRADDLEKLLLPPTEYPLHPSEVNVGFGGGC